jgi:hypothetical protein
LGDPGALLLAPVRVQTLTYAEERRITVCSNVMEQRNQPEDGDEFLILAWKRMPYNLLRVGWPISIVIN